MWRLSCLVLATAVVLVGCTSTPTPAPSATAPVAEPACTEFVLRGARDETGGRPLLAADDVPGRYWMDGFFTHYCVDDWALVEANHTSGSAFDFWLLRAGTDSWEILASTSIRLDTAATDPLFSTASLPPEVLVDEIVAAFGARTTSSGRPLFDS